MCEKTFRKPSIRSNHLFHKTSKISLDPQPIDLSRVYPIGFVPFLNLNSIRFRCARYFPDS